MVSLDFQEAPAAKKPARDYDDLFDDDDDDRVMDEGLSDTNSPVKKAVTGNDDDDDDDDDFLMPATGRVRNRGAMLDDENSLGERKNNEVCYEGDGPPQTTRAASACMLQNSPSLLTSAGGMNSNALS